MTKITKKAILSAKDSVKSAREKMTKIAQDMVESETAPSPEQVKEIVESIGEVAQEIEQQADMVADGLEGVTDEGNGNGNGVVSNDLDNPENDKKPPKEGMNELDEETKKKMEAQEEKIKELEEFKETNEKEKMASDYAKLFPQAQRNAKFTEFMKMDKPNSELKTVLSATESALTSLTKNASMRKSNETIIFNETKKQKNASMYGLSSGNATSLAEI